MNPAPTACYCVSRQALAIPSINLDRHYGPGAYLRYPPGSSHDARSTIGCTFLVINAKVPKLAAS